jgi:NADH dehydrogenase [ubiquinone] 1 alpha subcomplex assembly factor 6
VIPAEISSKHGLRQEELVRKGPEAQGLEDAVFEFATLANDHMITARSMLKEEGFEGKIPPAAMPVFLAGVMLVLLIITKLYDAYVWSFKIPVANLLQRLEKNACDPFDPKLQRRDWKLPWLIYRGYYRGQF